MHLFTQFGDEVQSVSDQELLGQRVGEVAFVPKEVANQSCGCIGAARPTAVAS